MLDLGLPQVGLPDPTQKLSSDFIREFGKPAGLWVPSKLALAAADFSGNGNFGTLNGGVNLNANSFGVLENSWALNGTAAQFIDFGNVLAGPSKLTLFALVKPSSTSMTFQPLICKGAGAVGGREYGLILSGPNVLAQVIDENTSTVLNATTTATFAAKQQFAAALTWDGSTVKAYLNDSVTSTSGTATIRAGTDHLKIGADENPTNSFFGGNYYIGIAFVGVALSASQLTSLRNALKTGNLPLFEPDNLFLDEPAGTTTTINLTAKSFVFSSVTAPESILRPLSAQQLDQTDLQANITITRPLRSNVIDQTSLQARESVAQVKNAQSNSQTLSNANEQIQRILSSNTIIVQTLSNASYATSTLFKSTSISQSFSHSGLNIQRPINSSVEAQSLSKVSSAIQRAINSKQISITDSLAEVSIKRFLDSEVIVQSLANGNFTTSLYNNFQLLSFRRYSSQYFVQGGNIPDMGQ